MGLEDPDNLLEALLGDGRNDPMEPNELIPLILTEVFMAVEPVAEELIEDDIDCSFRRIVGWFGLAPFAAAFVLLRTWCFTLSKAVSTRRIFPAVFMLGLLVWSLSQHLPIKSLIAFDMIPFKSGR